MKKILLFIILLFSIVAKGQDTEHDNIYIRESAVLKDSSVTTWYKDTLVNPPFVRSYVSSVLTTPYDNAIYVAKSGSDYTSIKDALDAITDNDVNNRYVVWVAPGLYTENNPITGKSFVTVISMGDNNTVRVIAQNGNQDLFIGAAFFYLEGLSLFGVTGANNYAVNMSSAGEMLVDKCVFTDCSNGILLNNTNGFMNILNSALFTIDADMSRGLNVNAGNATVDFFKVVQRSDIDTLIRSCGSNSILTLNNIVSFSDSVDVGFYFCDTSRISGYGSRMVGLNDGIIIEGDSVNVRLDVVQIFNATNDGFRIESTGNGIELALFATTISGCERWNFNVENSDVIVSGNGFTELDKGYIEAGAGFYAYLLDTKTGDEGLNILGELHVGTAASPTESVFGGGDSYNNNMLVYEYNGSTYANVTDSAISVDGNCVNFPNTSANTAIYIASTVMDSALHYGLKMFVLDSMTIGSGAVVSEYWNGSTWAEFNGMVTDGDEPYLPYAKRYFEQDSTFIQIRYDAEMTNDDWRANDPPTIASDHKWVRYRITTAITSSPRIDQIKLHPERLEINANGFQEMFGNSRNFGNLALTIGSGGPFEGNMQNQTIYVDQDLGVGFRNNRFTATADKLGFSGFIPFNFDSSTKVKFVFSGRYVTGGTAQWTVRYRWISPDSTIYTSEPASSGLVQTSIINATVTAGINEIFLAEIDLSEAIARRQNGFGDQLWVSLQPTTLPGSFDLTTVNVSYLKWCEGGHW
jgi:hypothetical protein